MESSRRTNAMARTIVGRVTFLLVPWNLLFAGAYHLAIFRVTNAELNHGYVLGVLRQSWSDRSRDLENCIVMLISWTGYQWSDRTLSIVLVHRWKCPIRCHQSLIVDHQNYTLTMNWLEELSTFSIGYTSARAFASGLVCHFCFNSATFGILLSKDIINRIWFTSTIESWLSQIMDTCQICSQLGNRTERPIYWNNADALDPSHDGSIWPRVYVCTTISLNTSKYQAH